MGRFKNEKFANFKRCAILDAAVKEFTEKGIEKASMRAIAAAEVAQLDQNKSA